MEISSDMIKKDLPGSYVTVIPLDLICTTEVYQKQNIDAVYFFQLLR